MTVESEIEITAFDDMILAVIVLIYVFGWYFYVHCWSLISSLPEIGFLFYLFPGLYFIILGIPTAAISISLSEHKLLMFLLLEWQRVTVALLFVNK
jgi:uncharacterized membrane protein